VQLTPLSTHWAPRKKKGSIFFGHLYYSTPFNIVTHISAFRRYLTEIFLHSKKLISLRYGEKEIPLHREEEHFFMHNDILPHFIRPEAEEWQTVFFLFWGWEGRRRKTRLNAKESF